MESGVKDISSLTKAERVEVACKEARKLKHTEEGLRSESVRRQAQGMRDIASKWDISHSHVIRIVRNSRKGEEE